MKKSICTLVAVLMIVMTASVVSAMEAPSTVIKNYELTEEEEFVEFILEGYDGAYTSSMTMPNGRVITMTKSTKINDSTKPYWTNAYSVKSAPKGKYTFKINAPKQAYYNLKVNVPLFSDIPNHWAQNSINTFVEKGIISGYGDGRFGPNDLVTGEALIKMAVLGLTEEQPNGKRQWMKTFRWKVANEEKSRELGFLEYSFIADKSVPWAKPYLTAAGDLGITTNWKDEGFAIPFKRKDVALLVANVMNMVKVSSLKPSMFQDTKSLPDQYQEAIDLVSNYSVFSGYPDGTFKPENQVSRAEAVIVLSRLIEFLK
ncbi:S-layer homology domain-containing protein [Paenibacillus alkaliterrae]|uniref:S-layer homology domain-containing protein n=1 Tax=Paenibacillus alkaliterrae TaxID=320909 RepID=UPI001F198D60|nr:S-layer homology domain-containing protein [Paenibacillus alkaliterrae]MCF2940577.1 S-layer homology domain-containing protein [Paenibacillus alkaliterrae]